MTFPPVTVLLLAGDGSEDAALAARAAVDIAQKPGPSFTSSTPGIPP